MSEVFDVPQNDATLRNCVPRRRPELKNRSSFDLSIDSGNPSHEPDDARPVRIRVNVGSGCPRRITERRGWPGRSPAGVSPDNFGETSGSP